MDLQLVTEYRNLRILVQSEIREVLNQESFSFLPKRYDMSRLLLEIETAWVKEAIEDTTFLFFGGKEPQDIVYVILNRMDPQHRLRQLVFRRMIACNYRRIPEGELTLVLRPSGLYLYL